jgi:hypothetical protein
MDTPLFGGNSRILQDNLWEKFNRVSQAGIWTGERLSEMLDAACFAFLIMTGEDERNGDLHAREKVIHEIGLFQGKLGFRRAIILLEEGCKNFSNIHGLTYILFPRNGISAKYTLLSQSGRDYHRSEQETWLAILPADLSRGGKGCSHEVGKAPMSPTDRGWVGQMSS